MNRSARTFELPMSRTQRQVEPRSIGHRVSDATVFDTPTGRISWFGHRVEPDWPPVDATPMFQLWRDHHGDKGLEKAYLSWETLDEHPPPPLGPRDTLNETIGMACDGCDVRVELPSGFVVRPVVSQADEAQLLQGALAVHAQNDLGMAEYMAWSYAGLGALRASGRVVTLAVFAGEDVVSAVTVVRCGEERRGQDFWTRPARRRRGLCAALLSMAVRLDESPLILGVMRGSEAERLYRRLGFETVSHGWELARTFGDG